MNKQTVSAVPCGKDRHGDPITKRYTYRIDRTPEDWGDNRSRIFVENRTFRGADGKVLYTPVVVRTDSIQAQP